MVIRRVPLEIPDLAALGLPAPVERLAEEERGLLLVTGPRGAGKTTTVAALLDRINHRRSCTILTIEDPIEVIHPDAEAIVTQREVGTDPASYGAALHSGLRTDADADLVGERCDGPPGPARRHAP